MATWPRGKARVCKTLIPGPIPGVALKDLTESQVLFLFQKMAENQVFCHFFGLMISQVFWFLKS